MNPDKKLAYCAGLIDGEGTISIYKRRPTKARKSTTTEYTGRVSITMTKIIPIQFFCRTFHVPQTQIYCRKRKGNSADCFCWEARYALAAKIASALLPYLQLKRPQARLLLKLHHFQSCRSRLKRTERLRQISVPGRSGKGQKIWLRQRSKKYLHTCRLLCHNMNTLNKRGKHAGS